MKPIYTKIPIGLPKPFKVLHITDSHLCLADQRDNQRKIDLANSRKKHFDNGVPGQTEAFLLEQLAYARDHQLPILHTGDFFDFVSAKNLEYLKNTLGKQDYFFAAGNHEFSLYVGEAFEDEAYKNQSFDLVQSYIQNHLSFDSRSFGGINFIAVDNSYYLFTANQLELLQKEVAKGLPIVLMIHNPLHTQALYDYAMNTLHQPCAYLSGTPEELTRIYPEDRRRQQLPNPQTLAFIAYVNQQPLIKAVLAGHLHYHFETALSSGTIQYITGSGFKGETREIEFV